MCGAVGTGQPSAVECENHWQILQRDFLKDLVVTSLKESTVNVNDGAQSCFGLTAGKSNGVTFANSHVKKLIRMRLTHRFKLVSLAHRSGNHNDPLIPFDLFMNCIASKHRIR